MNEAHENITYMSTVFRLIEERVFSVKDRFLQRSFTNIVINRRSSVSQKQREPFPVFEQVGDGSAQARIRLDLLLLQLRPQPRV